MAHTLTDFKRALSGGGARPNLFEVTLQSLPPGISFGSAGNNDRFSMLCKAAALPASNIAPIDVPFRGRIFKVAGDRTFDTWTVTVINDEDFTIRNAMELWMAKIGQYSDGSGATNPTDYMATAFVKQLGRKPSTTGFGKAEGQGLKPIAQYKFYDIFPTNISQIDLSYDTSDTIEEFTVEFQVQYWSPERPGNTNASSDTTAT
jgi:hypothetical protein